MGYIRKSLKRDIHLLNEDGMVLCNIRDKEASHRAQHNNILISTNITKVTCKKCIISYGKHKKKNLQNRRIRTS